MLRMPHRRVRLLIAITLTTTCCLALLVISWSYRRSLVGGDLLTPPPTYESTTDAEKALPQHNLSLPHPEGKRGRYVKFSNQVRGLGWNNVLNDVLLCSHLAWRANRAYVFQDYAWNPAHYPWRTTKWRYPRTPLSALLAGPTAGGDWEDGDHTPRSIRQDHWAKVCPRKDTAVIHTAAAKDPIRGADAKQVLEHWVRLLNASSKRCVEIRETAWDPYPQTFDLWVVSTPRILSIWPEFRDSPVSRLLRPSPLVQTALDRNSHLFLPPVRNQTNPYEGVMAIHVRRGDYVTACQHFANYSSTFYQWNLLPELPDSFDPAADRAVYMARCFPSIDRLVHKIQRSKSNWEAAGARPPLTALYVMTNADAVWTVQFRARLVAEGWDMVVFGRDLVLSGEEAGVAMAVDMDVGRRAGVFVGNGWSSMTSNIVHRRLVDGHDPLSIRFW